MDAPKGSLIAYSTRPGKTAEDGSRHSGFKFPLISVDKEEK
jgi:hypothetical protein